MESSSTAAQSSSSKKLAKRKGRDRLSRLPNAILHHILSFLTTREVVRAGILSRRWRNLWVSMPCLFFDADYFAWRKNGIRNFMRFVDRVLILRDTSDLHTFRLQWSENVVIDYAHANIWIRHAVRHNVKVLELIYRGEEQLVDYDDDDDDEEKIVEVPRWIFTCKSLEALSLKFVVETNFMIPEITSLGRLKRLHLSNCYMFCFSMNDVNSGCPVLEDLHLEYCFLGYQDTYLHLSSNTLKSLTIKNCYMDEKLIRISIPSLISLHCDNHGILIDSAESNLSLVRVYVGSKINGLKFGYKAFNLIRQLSNARKIGLFGPWLEPLSEEDLSEFPAFHNLKTLTLGSWCMSDNLQPVHHFLQQSPNIEMLTLDDMSFNSEANWKPREKSFDCPHLNVVEIRNCSEQKERVDELVKVLKEKLPVVERVSIVPSS